MKVNVMEALFAHATFLVRLRFCSVLQSCHFKLPKIKKKRPGMAHLEKMIKVALIRSMYDFKSSTKIESQNSYLISV